jgi:predicted DNA-binding transcriptional regulator AlpA
MVAVAAVPALLNTRGAAARLGVGYSTLRRMSETPDGPQPVKVGNTLKYRTADLDAWVASLPAAYAWATGVDAA